jgi:hypothetical protein
VSLRLFEIGIVRFQRRHHEYGIAVRGVVLILSVVAACLLIAPSNRGQSDQPTEYAVKAAFLFNFTKFVEWPESAFSGANSPMVIGIVGDDPFGDSLARIVAGQKVEGRAIVIWNKHYGEDLRGCHVLFISASESRHGRQILADLQATAVLTVSDIEGFAQAGGIMQFVMEDNHVRFVINLDAAAHKQLHVSAKLLALARVINGTEASR